MRIGLLGLLAAVLLPNGLAAMPANEARSKSDERPAYFGFAFNYKYDESPMELGVCALRAGTPADKGGIKMDDRIVAVDGRRDFKSALDVLTYLFAKKAGEALDLTVTRGEEILNLRLVGGEASDEQIARMRRNLELAKKEAEQRKK